MTVRLLALPIREQLTAAHDVAPAETRELTIIEVVGVDGESGFGECSALTNAGYTPESARGAFREISTTRGHPTSPMAFAGVEMARIDLELRSQGRSLAQELHGRSSDRSTVPPAVRAGVVLPLGPVDATVRAAQHWVGEGVARLKLKVEPGWLTEPVTAVRQALPDAEIHVDANGSCGVDQLAELVKLAELGVTAFEQPFAGADRASAVELVRQSSAVVLADEAATDLDTIVELVEAGACTGVVIKPGRLGGLERTIAVHDWCANASVPLVAGGMLECGLGRHALAAVASLPGFTICGDVSPARRWLADDAFSDLSMVDGWITVPPGPGVAPPPDRAVLDRYTIEATTVDWRG